jgi:hypothetical protein
VDGVAPPVGEPMPWPGYEPPVRGRGLLGWDWAEARLERSRRYWLATTGASDRPHLAAVWGVWVQWKLIFSTGRATRKARNLALRPECSISTEDAEEAVIMHGRADETQDGEVLKAAERAYIAKYGSSLVLEDSPVFVIQPRFVVGIVDSSTSALPTRWRFGR